MSYENICRENYLFVVFSAPTTGFYENKAFCAFDVLIAQCAALTMLYGEVISGAINEFEGGKNLRQLALHSLVER